MDPRAIKVNLQTLGARETIDAADFALAVASHVIQGLYLVLASLNSSRRILPDSYHLVSCCEGAEKGKDDLQIQL